MNQRRIRPTPGFRSFLIFGALVAAFFLLRQAPPSLNERGIALNDHADFCPSAGCRASGHGVALQLLLPEKIVPLRAFSPVLSITGISPTVVVLGFDMPEMEMMPNEFLLQQTTPSERWQGEAILPVCSSGELTWRAKAKVTDARGNIYSASWLFKSEK